MSPTPQRRRQVPCSPETFDSYIWPCMLRQGWSFRLGRYVSPSGDRYSTGEQVVNSLSSVEYNDLIARSRAEASLYGVAHVIDEIRHLDTDEDDEDIVENTDFVVDESGLDIDEELQGDLATEEISDEVEIGNDEVTVMIDENWFKLSAFRALEDYPQDKLAKLNTKIGPHLTCSEYFGMLQLGRLSATPPSKSYVEHVYDQHMSTMLRDIPEVDRPTYEELIKYTKTVGVQPVLIRKSTTQCLSYTCD